MGLLAVFWGAFLPALVPLLARLLGPSGRIRISMGMSSMAIELTLAIAAIVVGIGALRKGERSWMMLVAFILAILVGGFWIYFVAGEVLYPH